MNSAIHTLGLIFSLIIAMYIFVIDIAYFVKIKSKDNHGILKLVYAFDGIFWTVVYSIILINPDILYSNDIMYYFRIGILITLISLGLGATVRAYTAGIFGDHK